MTKTVSNAEIDTIVQHYWDEEWEAVEESDSKGQYFPALAAYKEFVEARTQDKRPSEDCLSTLEFYLEKVLELDLNSVKARKTIPKVIGLVPVKMKTVDIVLKSVFWKAVDYFRYSANQVMSAEKASQNVADSLSRLGIGNYDSNTIKRLANKHYFDEGIVKET